MASRPPIITYLVHTSLDGDARRLKGACLLFGVYTLRNLLNNGCPHPQDKIVDAILSLSKTAGSHSDLRSAFYDLFDKSRPKNRKKKRKSNGDGRDKHCGVSFSALAFVPSSTSFSSVGYATN